MIGKKTKAMEAETFGMCYGNWGDVQCENCALGNECHDFSIGIILNSENPMDALISALSMKYRHFVSEINGKTNHLFLKDKSETPAVKIVVRDDKLEILSESWKNEHRMIETPKDAIEALKIAKRICVDL